MYTAPTGYTSIVLYAHITNYGSADTTVTMSHVSSTTTEIIKGANVPVNDAFVPMEGKLLLETNDSIKISAVANSTLKCILSILEKAT